MKKILTSLLLLITGLLSYTPGYIKEIRITSYYPNDSTGSIECTASGYCIKHFEVNEDGMYTFNGKIVIATPTYHCTSLNTGVCANYNSLPKGYHQYNLHDELVLFFNDKRYEAIVLDICGACYWEETSQRYDVFVPSKKEVIDTYGTIYIEHTINKLFLTVSVSLIIYLIMQFNYPKIIKIYNRH